MEIVLNFVQHYITLFSNCHIIHGVESRETSLSSSIGTHSYRQESDIAVLY